MKILLVILVSPMIALGFVLGFLTTPFVGGFIKGYGLIQNMEMDKLRKDLDKKGIR